MAVGCWCLILTLPLRCDASQLINPTEHQGPGTVVLGAAHPQNREST